MKLKLGLSSIILILASALLSPDAARADTVLYNEAGFIEGTQSFTQSFNITTPGTLTITLTDVPWLDTLSDLTCFLTSSKGLMGTSMSAGSEQMQVGPGTIYAHWFGQADGNYNIGVYGLKIQFQPYGSTTVSLPASLFLMLSGLGLLFGWQRKKDYSPAAA